MALHKVHAGVQRYGDVIIIRNGDGSIESRDVSPAVHGPAKRARPAHFPKRCQSLAAATKYGGQAKVKEQSQIALKSASQRIKSTSQLIRVKHSARSRSSSHSPSPHARLTREDDVVIIHNADGSVEARDAQ